MVRGRLAFRSGGSKPEACGRVSLCVRRDARPTQMPLKNGNLKDLGGRGERKRGSMTDEIS